MVVRSNQFGPQKSKSNTLTPKNQLADILTNGNFTRDEWNHLLCFFDISHFSSTNCLEVMSKRTQEDAGEERVTAKSKPMMNLVSRCSVRDPNVLASAASESREKSKSESQNVPLSSWNEQQPRTGRLVMGACSSNYSEWKIDEKWTSQEWKSDEMLEARTGRRVDDKFDINDDMDSDTATESELSPKSRSFLQRVNDRVRKKMDQIFKRYNARHRQTFYDFRNVCVFDIGSLCIHGKELLRTFTFHQKYREQSHDATDVRHI